MSSEHLLTSGDCLADSAGNPLPTRDMRVLAGTTEVKDDPDEATEFRVRQILQI